MLHLLLLSASLALGATEPPAPPSDLPPAEVPGLAPEAARGEEPRAVQNPAPAPAEPPAALPPIRIVPETPAAAAEEPIAEAATPAARWFLMKQLQGTGVGYGLDTSRISISGWLAGSYTASQASFSNQPVVWNDRANEFMFQQGWVRVERSVVTSGTTSPSWGFRSDWLFGSDYRFSLPRGLWNDQLNPPGIPAGNPARQDIYGVDPIAFYGEVYIPTIGQGLDIKVGRIWTPFGSESMEAVSTPLMSRSYAFNWSPPFTHMGGLATLTINPQWTVSGGIVNGNDVFIDPAQEARFLGTVGWTQPGGKNKVTFGTSLGRGKFNSGQPFNPKVISLMSEAAGRNNINVFDLVWTHVINPRMTYQLECIYGYQQGVPTQTAVGVISGAMIDTDRLSGTAHWGSICQYLFYTFSPKMSGVLRFELFEDFEGQRTGYEGLYTGITGGVQFKPYPWLMFRPELRYDINNYSKPFDPDQTNTGTKNNLLTAGADLIVRW